MNRQPERPRDPWPLVVAPYVVLSLLMAVLVFVASSTITNYDTYFHLSLGNEFLHGWSLTHPGHLNHFASRDWLPTQWLSEMWMAWTENRFGLAGVAWLTGLWFSLFVLAVLVSARRQASLIIAVVVTAGTLIASHSGLSGRPQVLSYALMALVMDAWWRTRDDDRIRWWLIPLTWVWACLHGMWLLGVVSSFVIAGALWLSGKGTARWKLLALPVAMAVAAALTPVGPRLYDAVALVGSRKTLFKEWLPADFSSPAHFVFVAMLVAVLLLVLRGGQRDWFTIAMIGLSIGWAVYSLRTVPIAAVTVAPLLAGQLERVSGRRGVVVRGEKAAVCVVVAAALAALIFTSPHAARIGQPPWLNPALTALPQGTPVLTESGPAAYVEWRYLNVDTVISGYLDMYTDAQVAAYQDMIDMKPDWDLTVVGYGTRIALLPDYSSLHYGLIHSEGWRVVHHSTDLDMLVAPTR